MYRLLRLLAVVPILLPPLLFAVTLPRVGALHRNDYWGDFRQVIRDERITPDPRVWVHARSNEHRIALPLLLWVGNAHLTHGDNRALAVLTGVALAASFACLWPLLPAALRASPASSALFGTLLSAYLFTPAAAHNWVLGFSGNQWVLANLSSLAAILLLVRLSRTGSRRMLVLLLLAGLAGAFCHGTHLAVWPALSIGALLLPVPRRAFLLLATAGVTLSGFFWWQLPHSSAPAAPAAPATFFAFASSYLGLLASQEPGPAQAWGTAALLLAAAAAVEVLRRRDEESRRTLVPWLLVVLYAGGNALGSALARARLGEQMALSSRYASLPALFWLGTLTLVGLLAWTAASRRPALRRPSRAVFALLALLSLVPMYRSGTQRLGAYLSRQRHQPLAALALLWRVEDPQVLRTLTLTPAQLDWSRPWFERVGHVPFDRAAEWRLGSPCPAARAAGGEVGRVTRLEPVDASFFAVAGSVDSAPAQASRVLFLDGEGLLRGGGVFVPARIPAPRGPLWPAPAPPTHWRGYLERGCHPGVEAWLASGDGLPLRPLALDPGVRKALDARTNACAAATAS